jgi:hypothetical protein
LWFKIYGVIPDFYFDVFCRNGEEAVTWHVCYSQTAITSFEAEIMMLSTHLLSWIENPDETGPRFARCKTCPVKDCLDKRTTPDVKVIEIR